MSSLFAIIFSIIASNFHALVKPFTFWFIVFLMFSFILLVDDEVFFEVGIGVVIETWSAVDGTK